MMQMPVRSRLTSRLAAAFLAATLLSTAGCAPSPAASPSSLPPVTASPTVTPQASPTGPSPFASFVRPTPTPLPTFLVYVVRRGDTLTSIARAFDTTPFSIAYWNREAYPTLDPDSDAYEPDKIETGWSLVLIPNVMIDDSDLPAATATPPPAATSRPSPTPSATQPATAVPKPTAGQASIVVRHGPRTAATVALTFDMGGRLDPALDIVAWLAEEDVHATIFPTGKTGTTTTTGRAVLDRIALRRDLFDLGNHTWSHPDLRELDDASIRDQLDRTDTAVVVAVNMSTKPWFRPPYGALDDQIPAVVGAAGWGYTVLWDVDTIDWRPESDGGPTAADIVAKVVGNARGGSIVLMHLGGYHTLEALPGIVDGLRAKGLTPVTLDEMFGS
jgi:peptidoglycan/xylan/chitin deacetylase (PgdA/CDA1 family)